LTEETLFSANITPSTVDQLVGEGKKFKTIDDLAKAKIEADAFIQRLQDENKGIREDLNSRVRAEELLETLESRLLEGTQTTDNNQNRSESPNTPDINKLIEQTLTKREAEKSASTNLTTVRNELKKYFGDDYESKVKTRTDALSLTDDELNELAKRSPAAFLKLVGVTGGQQAPTYNPPTSTTQMPTTSVSTGQRNYKYYSDLRKADPSSYWKPETQLQLHKDAIAAANRGEDFYS
jgi:YesN/AraC family two-component response regulator